MKVKLQFKRLLVLGACLVGLPSVALAGSSCVVDGKDSSVTYTGNWWDSDNYTLQTDPLGGTYSVGSVSSAIHIGYSRLGNGSDYESGVANFPNCFNVDSTKYYTAKISFITTSNAQFPRGSDVPVTVHHLDENGSSTTTVVDVDMSDSSGTFKKTQSLGSFKGLSGVEVSNAPSDSNYVAVDTLAYAEVESTATQKVGGIVDSNGSLVESSNIISVATLSTGHREICIDPALGWQPPFSVTATGHETTSQVYGTDYNNVNADNCFILHTKGADGNYYNLGFSFKVENYDVSTGPIEIARITFSADGTSLASWSGDVDINTSHYIGNWGYNGYGIYTNTFLPDLVWDGDYYVETLTPGVYPYQNSGAYAIWAGEANGKSYWSVSCLSDLSNLNSHIHCNGASFRLMKNP